MDATELIETLLVGQSADYGPSTSENPFYDQMQKRNQFSAFASDLKQLFSRQNQLIVLPQSTDPSFIFWFFLGGFFNIQCSGLMGKLGIRDIYIKHDRGMVRMAYLRVDPRLRINTLSFRTVWLTEPPLEIQTLPEINTFTESELTELVHKWNLDYYFVNEVIIDDKYFEIKERFSKETGEKDLNVESKVQPSEYNRELLQKICKNRRVDEMFRKPYHLQEEEFAVITEGSNSERQELQTWLNNLHSNDIDTVKTATSNLLHKFHAIYRFYCSMVSFASNRDDFIGYLTGAFTFNYMRRFKLLIRIQQFPIGQYALLTILPTKKLNSKLDLNIPIVIDATHNQELPANLAKVIKCNGIVELLPCFNTDSKVAILGIVNYNLPESLQPRYIDLVVSLNQGILYKFLHIYQHFIKKNIDAHVAQDILNSELMHLLTRQTHQSKSSLIRMFLYGQLVSMPDKLRLHDNIENTESGKGPQTNKETSIRKAIFEYDNPVLKQEITTFLIFHRSCLIAFNVGKEDEVREVTETFFGMGKTKNLFKLPKFDQTIDTVLHVNFVLDTMFGNYVDIHNVDLNDYSQGFNVHNGELHFIDHVDVIPVLKSLEQTNFQYIIDHLSEPLFKGKEYFLNSQHFKLFMVGLLTSQMTILTPMGKLVDSVICVMDRRVPEKASEAFSVKDLLHPSISFLNKVMVENQILLLKLASVDSRVDNVSLDPMNEMILSFTADYFLHLDLAQSDTSKKPILGAILCDLGASDAKNLLKLSIWEPTIGIHATLPTLAALVSTACNLRRSKRSANNACQFRLEDAEEFISESGVKDNIHLEIDSDKLFKHLAEQEVKKRVHIMSYVGDMDIDESKFTGSRKSEAVKLTSKVKIVTRLHRIAKLADTGSITLMGKDLLGEVWSERYKDAAATISFIIGGIALGMTSQAIRYKATNLGIIGQKTGSNTLHFTAPFIGKLASGYILYDLIQNIQKIKHGEQPDVVLANLLMDSTFLIIDVVDVGLEVAATFGIIEEAAILFSSIGSVVGGLIFVGGNVYATYNQVKHMDQIINLTTKEVIIESLRAFIGLEPERYIEQLVERKQRFEALTLQANEFLLKTSKFRRYIFPTQNFDGKKWIDDSDNSIDLTIKLPTHYLARDKPNMPSHVKLLCFNNMLNKDERIQLKLPINVTKVDVQLVGVLRFEELEDDKSYLCEQSIGISNQNVMVNRSLIDLRHGDDEAKGFKYSQNVFLIGNGVKTVLGGYTQDTFIFTGNRTLGTIYGGHNHSCNTLDLSQFAKNSTGLTINLARQNQYIVNNGETIFVKNMKRLITRFDQNDYTIVGCNTENVLSTGGNDSKYHFDTVFIPNITCNYKLNIEIGNQVIIFNHALLGNFNYLIRTSHRPGSVIHLPQNSKADQKFIFSQPITALISIMTNLTTHRQRFQFNGNYFITIANFDSNNCTYYFKDNVELKFTYKLMAGNASPVNIHGYLASGKTPMEIIEIYSKVACRLQITFFAHSLSENATIFISHSNKNAKSSNPSAQNFPNILHNDPHVVTYFYGAESENVYVIETHKQKLMQISDAFLPDVYIIEPDEINFTRTITFQNLVYQLNKDLNCSIHFGLYSDLENNLVLHADAAVKENPKTTILRLILNNAVSSGAYKQIHIIGKLPMKIVLNVEQNEYNLVPLPITLKEQDNFILLHPENVTKNLVYEIPRSVRDFKLFKNDDNQSLILIENPHQAANFTKFESLFFILLMKFEENLLIYTTLQFVFANKVIDLATMKDKISSASMIKEEIKKIELGLMQEINKFVPIS